MAIHHFRAVYLAGNKGVNRKVFLMNGQVWKYGSRCQCKAILCSCFDRAGKGLYHGYLLGYLLETKSDLSILYIIVYDFNIEVMQCVGLYITQRTAN